MLSTCMVLESATHVMQLSVRLIAPSDVVPMRNWSNGNRWCRILDGADFVVGAEFVFAAEFLVGAEFVLAADMLVGAELWFAAEF